MLNVHVFEVSYLNDPVWVLPNVSCDHFQPPKKANINSNQMKQLFLEDLEQFHSDHNSLYTDGSKTANGVAGAVFHNDMVHARKMNSDSSIFTAELRAVLSATTMISDRTEFTNFSVFTDSLSAKSTLTSFNSSHPIICKILHQLIKVHKQGKTVKICRVPAHIGINGNEAADEAARDTALS